MTSRCARLSSRGESGAALAVGLIMLLVMSMTGILSMESAVFQNLLSMNNQFYFEALSDAEAVMVEAENDVEKIVSDGIALDLGTTDDHYYSVGAIDVTSGPWAFAKAIRPHGNYVIEYAGPKTLGGESGAFGAPSLPGAKAHLFVLTARSTSSKGATRLVQTVYPSRKAP
jgi:Tfp pilus assembly protein PilX